MCCVQKMPPLGGMPPSKEAITLAIAQYEAKMQVQRLCRTVCDVGKAGHVANERTALLFLVTASTCVTSQSPMHRLQTGRAD